MKPFFPIFNTCPLVEVGEPTSKGKPCSYAGMSSPEPGKANVHSGMPTIGAERWGTALVMGRPKCVSYREVIEEKDL